MNSEQLIAQLKRYPLAVGCGIVVIIAGVLIFLRGGRVDNLETEYNTKLTESELMSANSKNAVDLKKHLEELNQIADSIDSRLVNAEAPPENYRYFLQLAEKAQVDLTSQSQAKLIPVKETGNQFYPAVDFTLNVTGEYKKVLRFLYELETNRFITRIDSMNLSPSTLEVTQENVITASIKVSNLGKPPPEAKEKKK